VTGNTVRQTSKALAAILILGALSSALAYDSLNMRIVGRWPFTGCQLGVGDTSRNLCFAACGGGVYVLDITDPANPRKLSERIQSGGIVRDLYFDHALSRLYVACEEGGLELWDVRTANAPYRLGACPTPSRAWSVLVSGRYAFIANREQGVSILDILDPANPHEVGRYDTPGDARDLVTVGQRLFVADLNTLQVLDWSNPQNIVPVGELTGLSATGIVADGRYAYLSSGGMTVVDIRDPYHPAQVGYCNTTSATLDIALVGSYVYAACDAFGLNFIDITNPTAPIRTGQMNLTWGDNIKVIGSHGYALGSELVFLDASTPGSPRNLGNFVPHDLYGGIAVQGDYAYLTTWDGLIAVSIADLSNTFEVGRVDVPGWNTDVVVQGDYAYVGSQGSGTSVVDISDPANPRVLGTADDRGICERIAVQDSIVVVAGQFEVPIINVADPTNPHVVGVFDSLWSASGIAIQDSIVLVADPPSGDGGLRVVSIANPSLPRQIGFWPTTYHTRDVSLSDVLACTAESDSGLAVVSVADPRSPRTTARLALTVRADFVAWSGATVYVVSYGGGVRAIDVTDPASPREVGYHTRPFGQCGGKAVGGRFMLVDGGLGLTALEYSSPGVSQGPGVSPTNVVMRVLRNPVCGDPLVVLLAAEPRDGLVDFSLIDAAGRLAGQHSAEQRASRAYDLPIDGLPSGVYLLRASWDGRSETARVLLLNR
jgi:hypothetical protein